MNRFTGFITILFFYLFATNLQAQEDEHIDSLEMIPLSDVVITGQYEPQSVDKSLYQVEIITSEDIKNQAGNNVADVLNQNLNILVTPNSGTGNSNAEILGLNGAYVKVLVDNIPLVGDEGTGNNIDLTKINLDNVERIEIVKGAMGVDYGSNALAGIINIITKKKFKTDWKISFMIQEETVGEEYDWYEDAGVSKGKGRHIQAIDISKKINENWSVSAGLNRNDFQGFWGEKKGRKYFEQDDKRGYEWLPKEQWNANASINYHAKNFNAFYKLSYLDEQINFYNSVVNPQYFENGETTFYADDKDYFTNRWSHHLNLNLKLFHQVLYNADFSYQTQELNYQQYTYDIPTRQEISREDKEVYLSTHSYYARGTFSQLINRQNLDFQLGYELENDKGFANQTAADFGYQDNVEKEVGTYAGFVSAEIKTNSGISFRPGFRASFNPLYSPQFSYSLNTKFDLTDHSHLRAVIGTANRFPNFMELYTHQIDINHTILGDPNLVPEEGYSTAIQWNNRLKSRDFIMQNNLSTMYINVDDRIELVQLDPLKADFKFLNINKFRSWGISTENRFSWNQIKLGIGLSYLGTSKSLYSETFANTQTINDKYRYTFQANAFVNYTFPQLGTTLSAYYKYNGKTTQYVADTENSTPTETVYRLGEIGDFNMLDASIRKGFADNRFEVTFGVRNIFDVTDIKNTVDGMVGHGEAEPTQGLFYGRSYFLKLMYTLEF